MGLLYIDDHSSSGECRIACRDYLLCCFLTFSWRLTFFRDSIFRSEKGRDSNEAGSPMILYSWNIENWHFLTYLEKYVVKGGKIDQLLAGMWENNSSVGSCGLQISNDCAGWRKGKQREANADNELRLRITSFYRSSLWPLGEGFCAF